MFLMSSVQMAAFSAELTALFSKCLHRPIKIQISTIKICCWFRNLSNKKANHLHRIIVLNRDYVGNIENKSQVWLHQFKVSYKPFNSKR